MPAPKRIPAKKPEISWTNWKLEIVIINIEDKISKTEAIIEFLFKSIIN